MYWYYPVAAGILVILLGLAGLGGSNAFLLGRFKNQAWTPFCRKEHGIHALVVGAVYCVVGFSCWYFSFTRFETFLWMGLALIPTVSDYRMLYKKYKSLL